MISKRLPDLYCPVCKEGWGGAAPPKTHQYILNEWHRKHSNCGALKNANMEKETNEKAKQTNHLHHR